MVNVYRGADEGIGTRCAGGCGYHVMQKGGKKLQEWEEMQQACDVLKPFEEVTVQISGEGNVFFLMLLLHCDVIIM